jgi:hypothetical protein
VSWAWWTRLGSARGGRGEDAGWYDRLVWLFSSFGNNWYGMLSSVNVGLCGGVLVAHVLLDEASLEGARGISGMGELMPKLGN